MKRITLIFIGLLLGISGCMMPKTQAAVNNNPSNNNPPISQNRENGVLLSVPQVGLAENNYSIIPTLASVPLLKGLPNGMPSGGYTVSNPGSINPLTGMAVKDPQSLLLPPALVTITNWPPSARPQAGLSFSPMVFEWYIGEGMSRYQAMFYGDYPEQQNVNVSNPSNPSGTGTITAPLGDTSSAEATLGPIRSGRLPFEKVRSLYNGFLIMASAYSGVAQHLNAFTNIFGSDSGNINSAMIKVTQLRDIAANSQKKLGATSLSGMAFDDNPPAGGQPASRLWFMYNILNEALWNYDDISQVYHRYQYTEENKNTFVEDTDRLNGKGLGFSNIIVLYAEHRYCTETAYDVDLMYVNKAPALLFRDGQVYKIFWTTKNGDYEQTTGKVRPIRFIDDQGNPFPLKPGQTWIHVVPLGNSVWETAPSTDVDAMITDQKKVDSGLLYNWIFRKQDGSGIWATQYRSSLMIQDDAVCTEIRTQMQ